MSLVSVDETDTWLVRASAREIVERKRFRAEVQRWGEVVPLLAGEAAGTTLVAGRDCAFGAGVACNAGAAFCGSVATAEAGCAWGTTSNDDPVGGAGVSCEAVEIALIEPGEAGGIPRAPTNAQCQSVPCGIS